jgi:hypothetical protein
LGKQLSHKELAGVSRQEARAVREDQWQAVLDANLVALAKASADVVALKPREAGEPWRLELAAALRQSGAPYAWIAAKLGFPKVDSLRVRLHQRH